MRLAYISPERPDLACAMKHAAREMHAPTNYSLARLRTVGRYLVGKPRAILKFPYQYRQTLLDCETDADFAGCKQSRKSTSGGAIFVGKHCIKSWSVTQNCIAISTSESEFYAMLKGASCVLGVQSLYSDFNIKLDCQLSTDASAAKVMSERIGLGRAKHINVCYLWLQKLVQGKRLINIRKVKTGVNRANVLTKALIPHRVKELLRLMGMVFV